MKYVIVIPDGAADQPLDELDGQTPLESAATPHLDQLALGGRQGTVVTTPAGMPCGSDVCTMSLLGYDPARYHSGRAPLEAAAMGLNVGPEDWVFRVNTVTVTDGVMTDHSAGHIGDAEARQIIGDFTARLDDPALELYPGVAYRHILLDRGGRDWSELQTTAPHDIPGEPIRKRLPVGGEHAGLLHKLIAESQVMLEGHEVNRTRREMGELPATHLWPWGQGKRPQMPAFTKRFGIRACMITAVDLLAGIAACTGIQRLDVPGQTSFHDTDYAAAGHHGVAALDTHDLVIVHIEAPDEAAHASDAVTKRDAIAAIDAHVVGPLREALEARDEPWRMLVLPDHYTLTATRKHDATPPPFVLAGHNIRSVVQAPYAEQHAEEADLHITRGHDLMEYFLRSGL